MAFNFDLLSRFKKRENPQIRAVYDRLVAQARNPAFYQSYGVEDSVSGRFDMIVLHIFLFFHRMKDEDETAKAFGQEIFDTFIEDMDRSLREMGVGYQAVPKRMKKVGEAFYGRVAAYDGALAEGGLADALHRNIYPDHESRPPQADTLADYASATASALANKDVSALQSNDLPLVDPEDFLND